MFFRLMPTEIFELIRSGAKPSRIRAGVVPRRAAVVARMRQRCGGFFSSPISLIGSKGAQNCYTSDLDAAMPPWRVRGLPFSPDLADWAMRKSLSGISESDTVLG
mgnify:CR=1 FL=1